jgi:hypothetical protein
VISCACWALTLHRRKAIVASLEDTVPEETAVAERGA